MFDPTSRYTQLAIKTLTKSDPDGEPRQIRYVERRFLPMADAVATLAEHTVLQGDRLDNLTAKYIGDPTQFWRLADANDTLRPEELTEEIGWRVRIALSQL